MKLAVTPTRPSSSNAGGELELAERLGIDRARQDESIEGGPLADDSAGGGSLPTA